MKKGIKNRIWILIFVLAFSFISCEEITTWDIIPSERFLVVDGIITNELKVHEILVYASSEEMNREPEPASGVEIQLFDGDNTILFSEDTSLPGRYISEYPFRALPDRTYQLSIRYIDSYDTAYAKVAEINPLEPLIIVDHEDLYRFQYIQSELPSMTEVFYDWSAVPQYCTWYGSCYAAETFYTLNSIDVSQEFAPPKQVISFPEKTKIVRRKYSLSEPHQRFIRSLLMETEWRGGIFDVEQGNVPTNFAHGTRGWFAACLVLTDSTTFY